MLKLEATHVSRSLDMNGADGSVEDRKKIQQQVVGICIIIMGERCQWAVQQARHW